MSIIHVLRIFASQFTTKLIDNFESINKFDKIMYCSTGSNNTNDPDAITIIVEEHNDCVEKYENSFKK